MTHWTDIFRPADPAILNPAGLGVTCGGCGKKRIVRSGDRLCIDCWEAAGCPKGQPLHDEAGEWFDEITEDESDTEPKL